MPASALTQALTTFPLVPLDANTSIVYTIVQAFVNIVGSVIELLFLNLLAELLFFTPPKQIGPLNRLYETATFLFVLIFSLTTLSFITTKTLFPFSPDYDYYTYFSRSFAAIVAVIAGKHLLNAAFVATNTLGLYIYPENFTLAFSPDQLANVAGALIVGTFIIAFGIYSMYKLAATALFLLIAMLAIRTLLLYTVYAFFPLFIAMWHLNIGPLDQSRELAEIAFKTFGILLGIGLLVAGILATGAAIGSGGAAQIDSSSQDIPDNLAKSDDCAAPPYADHCKQTSVMFALVGYFGSLLLALAATGSALAMLVSVAGSGKAKNTHLKQGSAQQRTPNTVAARARTFEPSDDDPTTEQQKGSPDPWGDVSHTESGKQTDSQQSSGEYNSRPGEGPTPTDKSDLMSYNDPDKWGDGERIDMESVTYHDSSKTKATQMHQKGYLEDKHGNTRPYVSWQRDDPVTLEDGKTYDIDGAKGSEYTQGNAHAQPVTSDMINEDGDFVEIHATKSTEISETTPNTPPGTDSPDESDLMSYNAPEKWRGKDIDMEKVTYHDTHGGDDGTMYQQGYLEDENGNRRPYLSWGDKFQDTEDLPELEDGETYNIENANGNVYEQGQPRSQHVTTDMIDENDEFVQMEGTHDTTITKVSSQTHSESSVSDLSDIDADLGSNNRETITKVTFRDGKNLSGVHQNGTLIDEHGNEADYSSFADDDPEMLEDGETYTLENVAANKPSSSNADHEAEVMWTENSTVRKHD